MIMTTAIPGASSTPLLELLGRSSGELPATEDVLAAYLPLLHQESDLDDRYRLKPAVLRAFGWNIRWVLTRDWLLDRKGVIARIEAALE
jgi:hypothetical protein